MKRFIDGTPIPDGYIPQVEALIEEICDIEEKFYPWELEYELQRKVDIQSTEALHRRG